MMRSYERFQQVMLAALQKQMLPVFESHRAELSQAVHNDLFQLDGPTEVEREYSAKDHFISKHFRGYVEIFKSLETLEDIHLYLRRYPFNDTRITRERYLQFHVECYFSEVYVLRERLKTYFKLIQRTYRKDDRIPRIKETCDELIEITTATLEGVVSTRGRHIHEQRFADKDIDRLGTLSLLKLAPDKKFTDTIDAYYKVLHREVRQKWTTRVRDDLAAIRKLLDSLFQALLPIVFDVEAENFRLPKRIET